MRPSNLNVGMAFPIGLKMVPWNPSSLVKYGRPIQVLSDLQLHSVDYVPKFVPQQADHLVIHGSLGFSKNHPTVQNFYEEVSKRFESVYVVPKVGSLACYEIPKLHNVFLVDGNTMLVDPYTALVRYPCVTNELVDSILDQFLDNDVSVILVDETFHNETASLVPFYGSYIRGILRPNLWNISFNKKVNGVRHISWNPKSFQSKQVHPVLF